MIGRLLHYNGLYCIGIYMNPILQYFEYAHLPPALQSVSKPICDIAHQYDDMLPDGPEKSAGLRKLLEAKDCLVRASLPVRPIQSVAVLD